MTDLSVVAPMYNEESNLDLFFKRVLPVLEGLKLKYEVVCVNDGSTDTTRAQLIERHHSNPAIKIVNLSRNFGKDIALSAGIDFAQGAAVVPIDSDLQDPPELISDFVKKWREGYDVVYATRRSRQKESWFKRSSSNLFYRVLDRLSEVSVPKNTGDFRLLDRRVVDALSKLPERTRFMKGLFSWVGFKQTAILFDREPRSSGMTKWNYWKLWNFAIDGIVSFSSVPLKVWSYFGISISLFAFVYAIFLIVRTLLLGVDVPGYASLIVVSLFMGGIQLVSLGVLGEYLGRVYNEVKNRPLYLVSESYGFGETALSKTNPGRVAIS